MHPLTLRPLPRSTFYRSQIKSNQGIVHNLAVLLVFPFVLVNQFLISNFI